MQKDGACDLVLPPRKAFRYSQRKTFCGQYTGSPTSWAVYTEGWKPAIYGAHKVPISGKHEHTSFSNDIIKWLTTHFCTQVRSICTTVSPQFSDKMSSVGSAVDMDVQGCRCSNYVHISHYPYKDSTYEKTPALSSAAHHWWRDGCWNQQIPTWLLDRAGKRCSESCLNSLPPPVLLLSCHTGIRRIE